MQIHKIADYINAAKVHRFVMCIKSYGNWVRCGLTFRGRIRILMEEKGLEWSEEEYFG